MEIYILNGDDVMGNATAAIMGGFKGVEVKARRDCIKALKQANSISSETAKTLAELGLTQANQEKAMEYLMQKKTVIQVENKFYLNHEA